MTTPHTSAAAQSDRAAGALLGAAAGDALGAGYEFTTPEPHTPIEMIGGGPFHWAPGEWTDDTAMLSGLVVGLGPGRVNLDAIAASFLNWYRLDPPDVGGHTRRVLGATDGTAADMTARALAVGHGSSNGALMRTAPVGVAYHHDPLQAGLVATQISNLTHHHLESRGACALWSIMIAQCVAATSAPPDWSTLRRTALPLVGAVLQESDGISPATTATTWDAILDSAEDGPQSPTDPAFIRNGGAVNALRVAWWSLVTTPDYVAAVTQAIRVGNDTDTTAAITGALAGAHYGAAAIPSQWVDLLHGHPVWTAADLRTHAARLSGTSAS